LIKVLVDPDKCIGAGHCVRAAAEVFDQREEDGIVVLLMAEAPDRLAKQLEKAETLCPSQAIRLESNQGQCED
jgi:ferredoxin